MRKRFYLLILCPIVFITYSACRKHKSNGPIDQLPPATQTGANTLGFLLNGTAWTPKGFNGSTNNLSVSLDENYKNGTFNITAYRILNNSIKEYLALGIADSLNFQTIPRTIKLGKPLFGLRYNNSTCSFDGFYDTLIYKTGQLTLSKYDKNSKNYFGHI